MVLCGILILSLSKSWEPLQKTCTLYEHLGNNTVDGASVLAESQLIETINEVHVVDMIIDNLDDGDHPFHLHGHKFYIMGAGDGRWQNQNLTNETPMMCVTLAFPLPFHCRTQEANGIGGFARQARHARHPRVHVGRPSLRRRQPGCLAVPLPHSMAHGEFRFRFVRPFPSKERLEYTFIHILISLFHQTQAAGLLFQLNMLPSESAKFDIPQYMLDQCARS